MPLNNLQHQDSGIRDNYIRGSVADLLNQIIQQDTVLSIVSAYFTIYACANLKDKLNSIWKAFYEFQKGGVKGAINKINAYNGCILADSVGIGKTYKALSVIKYFELLND